MGDERAETYLRLLAEVELRRAGDQLRGVDAVAGTGELSDPGMSPFAAAESALWRVVRAGRILAAAGALDRDALDRFAGELFSAITVRSRIQLSWYRSQGVLHTMFAPESGRALPSGRVSWAIRVTPIGRALRVASGHAPWALHFMSLVRAGGRGRDHRGHADALAIGLAGHGRGDHRGRPASSALRPAVGGGRPWDSPRGPVRGR